MRPINTTASLVEWLRKRPAEGEYNFWDCNNCLLAQYGKAMGFPHARGGATSFWGDAECVYEISIEGLDDHVATDRPHTFGAALARAEAVLAREEQRTGGR